MIRNENIICISSIDWDFIWQGHQEIMSTFARNGNRVLFIENTGVRAPGLGDIQRLKKRLVNWFKSVRGFREEMENLYVYSPVILPFPYSRIARYINRYMLINPIKKWMKAMEFHEPIIWTFLPTGIALDIINNIDNKLLVYYCIADFNELSGDPEKTRKTEDDLMRRSSLVFAQCAALKKRCAGLNSNVHIFPFGVKMETFDNSRPPRPNDVPEDMKDIKRPIIGYVGGIHRHIDFKLIRFVANERPEWSVVLIGPAQTSLAELDGLANVHLLGKKDFSVLPDYVRQFDVSIIPYEVSKYTDTVFPTKLNEYHAMGKPVVSTALPEVINFNKENDDLVLTARSHAEFVSHLQAAINKNDDAGLIRERVASARRNSWTARIEAMSALMEGAIEKRKRAVISWQQAVLKFYKGSRKGALTAVGAILALYLLVFHTPLVWFAAEPLKITQTPQKADCIVVFGGGVGESGRAGQGYEERVGYAVELYKKGYASHLIFCSAYTKFFEETLLMKAIAVALGVPKDAIILEDQARNTFSDVKFTREILVKEKWNKVLLVSSPYNMLRARLVFEHIAKDIDVVYTPLPQSAFYAHDVKNVFQSQVNVQQIKAIFHEYFGILYYWWKGWI